MKSILLTTIFTINLICNAFSYEYIPDSINIAGQMIYIDAEGKKRIDKKIYNLTKCPKYYKIYHAKVNQSIDKVKDILEKYNLHEDLSYVAVLESHLDPSAQHPTGAKGIWQFKYITANELGLIEQNKNIDKRDCIVASTHAASQYFIHHLKYLENDYLKVILAHHLGLTGASRYLKSNELNSISKVDNETHLYLIHFIAHYIVLNYN